MYPGARVFAAQHAVSIPLPELADDDALVAWVAELLDALVPLPATAPEAAAPS